MAEGIYFTSGEHQQRFLDAIQSIGKVDNGKLDKEYGPALYLLTADEYTWKLTEPQVSRTGIDFESILKTAHASSEEILTRLAWNLLNGGVWISPHRLARLSEKNYRLARQAMDLSRYDVSIQDLETTIQHTSQEWALALDQLAENTFFAWRLITVNGRKLPIPGDEASYETIVSLALGKVPPKDVLYTVVYGSGPAEKPDGSLLPGGSVKVRDGMVFSVAHTGNA